ncbi:acyl carrier protein [Cupriavidus pampae]|uniref:Acyl carrier protein n=1 Tax=Cupriavidus pampae TaxID=659251 RepID=A0ABN7ZLH0_9BURK|nr:acyl carrier protein [Cupriavidus pampae]CAG9185835.1 Acyl carrier protein [Cupriavidus pampae]
MTVAQAIVASIAVLVIVVWMARREIRAQKRKKAQKIDDAFSGRESLTSEAFYERYFLGLGVKTDVVAGIRAILEKQLDADMSRLRAEDAFTQNLSFFWDFDSMANVEIVVALEEHFQIKITDSEAEKTRTVSELVQLVSRKVGHS